VTGGDRLDQPRGVVAGGRSLPAVCPALDQGAGLEVHQLGAVELVAGGRGGIRRSSKLENGLGDSEVFADNRNLMAGQPSLVVQNFGDCRHQDLGVGGQF
jgi:hypothetical protein